MSSNFNPNYEYDIRRIPLDKHSHLQGKASQPGIVGLKCFINRECPLLKSPRHEDAIVFNNRTMHALLRTSDEKWRKTIDQTMGLEGIHFPLKYVYRHNYILELIEQEDGSLEWEEVPSDSWTAGQSKYKKEQSWKVVDSVFHQDKEDIHPDECDMIPQWGYHYETDGNKSNKIDLENDYPKRVIESELFDINNYQCPAQINSAIRDGVHWRLEKVTNLYRGEDFFVEFYNMADSADIVREGEDPLPFQIDRYKPLDVSLDPRAHKVKYQDTEMKMPVNNIVRSLSNDDDDENDDIKTFDFSSQPYYIIELGANDPEHNYFIVICQRANPIFCQIEPNSSGGEENPYIGRLIGDPCRTVSGRELMDARKIRVTVRNHLGKLVIYFSTDSGDYEPWIIEKTDIEVKNVKSRSRGREKEEPETSTVSTSLIIPKGKMFLWGGNKKSAFTFGPLQYTQKEEQYSYPRSRDGEDEDVDLDRIYDIDINTVTAVPQSLSLPAENPHFFRLTVADLDVADATRYRNDADNRRRDERLFTQDAQEYKEYGDVLKEGRFFFNDPIKEISGETSLISLDKVSIGQDEERRHERFIVKIKMRSGDHIFKDSDWKVRACKTPVLTLIRLVAEPLHEPRWTRQGLDVSNNVLQFDDSWDAVDFNSIEHTGTIQFLLNENMNVDINHNKYLESLQNKTFYIQVWAGYSCGSESIGSGHYTRLPGYYCLFTGLCHGGSIEWSYGKKIMTCQLHDYSKILKDQLFFNSPFFDGVIDLNAVNEILQMAGFRFQDPLNPASFINKLATNFEQHELMSHGTFLDGRYFRVRTYALPSSYQRLEQAFFKFNDGDNYYDAIIQIAERGAKLFYFDQFGIAHLENYMDIIAKQMIGEEGMQVDAFSFTTNPDLYSGQMVFNHVEYGFNVTDVHNHVKVLTTTPDQTPMVFDELEWNSIENPDVDGFMGYLKTFFQVEGMYGDEQATRNIIDVYRGMSRPPFDSKFETYGLPLRAFDFISIDGIPTRVVNVNHNIVPSENRWWMDVETELFQPNRKFKG